MYEPCDQQSCVFDDAWSISDRTGSGLYMIICSPYMIIGSLSTVVRSSYMLMHCGTFDATQGM